MPYRNINLLAAFRSGFRGSRHAVDRARHACLEAEHESFQFVIRAFFPFFMDSQKAGAQRGLLAVTFNPAYPPVVEQDVEGIPCILHAVTELRWCTSISHRIEKAIIGGLPRCDAQRSGWESRLVSIASAAP